MSNSLRYYAPAFALVLASGCANGPDPSAFRNTTFYEYGSRTATDTSGAFLENNYPPLDITERGYKGVQVLAGIVRFSRPSNWVLRRGSVNSEQRYVEYVSPSQITVAIYERLESPLDTWRDVMARYESQLTVDGATIIGKPFPVASFNAQGREYIIKRSIAAPKQPFINYSREILLRGTRRVILVQVVHQADNPGTISDEILPVLTSIQVL